MIDRMKSRFWPWVWAGVHNVAAHPLMWLFFEARWTVQLHDWSAGKAWPQPDQEART